MISLYPKENDIFFFDQGENRGNVEVGSHGARQWKKKSQKEKQSQGDTAIRAPTWQDVTCGEQEEETGQI